MALRRPQERIRSLVGWGALWGAIWGGFESYLAAFGGDPLLDLPPTTAGWWWGWMLALLLGATWGAAGSLLLSTALGPRRRELAFRLVPLAAWWLPASLAAFLLGRFHLLGWAPAALLALAAGGVLAAGLALALVPEPWRRRSLVVAAVAATAVTLDGARRAEPGVSGASPATAQHPHVILVTVDTARVDHLWPPPPWMPRWRELLDQERAAATMVTTPLPLTGPAHASLLTGLGILEHGALDNGIPVTAGVTTLAQRLSEEGFVAGASVSSAVLRRDLSGLHRGFVWYDDSFRPATLAGRLVFVQAATRLFDYAAGGGTGLSRVRSAGEVVELGLAFLQRHLASRRVFLWLHLYDPHAPYRPGRDLPEDLVGVPGEPTRQEDPGYWQQRRRYAGEFRTVDAALGRLRDALEDLGIWNSTLLVLATDHGESFGTHGRGYRFDHGAFVYDDQIASLAATWDPLAAASSPVAFDSDTRAPLSLAGAQTLEHLHDALLQRLGLEPATPQRGVRPFQSMIVADTLWTGVRLGRHKLLRAHGSATQVFWEAYDVASDPGEQRNLLPHRRRPGPDLPELDFGDLTWAAAADLLDGYADELRKAVEQAPALSEEARRALRSLGYIR